MAGAAVSTRKLPVAKGGILAARPRLRIVAYIAGVADRFSRRPRAAAPDLKARACRKSGRRARRYCGRVAGTYSMKMWPLIRACAS